MLKHDELNHEHYEELCALAVSGQICSDEFAELRSHLKICSSCRTRCGEFAEILHEHLPVFGSQEESALDVRHLALNDALLKRRFMERARLHGIEFSHNGDVDFGLLSAVGSHRSLWQRLGNRIGPSFWPGYALPLILLVSLLTVGALAYKLIQSDSRYSDAGHEVARLTSQIEQLRLHSAELSANRRPATAMESETQGPQPKAQASQSMSNPTWFQTELSRARRDYAMALSRSRSLEEQLQKASLEIESLRTEIEGARSTGGRWLSKRQDAELAREKTTEQLRNLLQSRSHDASTIAAQQVQIRELSEQLTVHSEAAQRERQLLAASRDIRDLMGARNLHIIDVADVDSKGKTRRPFGRIFYTEGKSLIFYAYDLADRKKLEERASFQAWGQREASSGSIESLGIFFADDRNQNRWLLKYEDPNILAQIDAVFVTTEPPGGSSRPRGQQLMYAYLKANPNHP